MPRPSEPSAPPLSPPGAILLSFDTEEFDLPLEYGRKISLDEQLDVGRRGLLATFALLDSMKRTGAAGEGRPQATFFTTLRFANAFPDLIHRLLNSGHELASHSVSHDSFATEDLVMSRLGLEQIARGAKVTGFRRPRMEMTDPTLIAAAGYAYDSSENPTCLPGRYNNLGLPRRARLVTTPGGTLVRIPASVTPLIRFPLFWLTVKHLPVSLAAAMTRWTLRTDGYAALYFHPWEFVDLSAYKLPRLVGRVSGEPMQHRLTEFLTKCRAPLRRYDSFAL